MSSLLITDGFNEWLCLPLGISALSFFVSLNLFLRMRGFHLNIRCKSRKTNSAALCLVQVVCLRADKQLWAPPSWQGRTHTSFPFAGTVLAREVHHKHASFPDPGRKIPLLMVTHSTLGLCFGDAFKSLFVLVQSIKNIINQTCSKISGTCCRPDTLGLLLLHWQVSAYRSMHIAVWFMLWMKTVAPGLPICLAKNVVSCPVSHRERQE